MNHLDNTNHNTKFKIREYAIVLFLCTSFLTPLFSRLSGSLMLHRLGIIGSLLLLVSVTPIIRIYRKDYYTLLWVPFILVSVLAVALGGFQDGAVTDIFTYVACLGILVLIGSDCAVYKKAYAVIIGFAVFYAVSIFVQMLLPSAYQLFLQLLPDEVVAEILEYEAEGILTGFSTNRGFTAGHIAAGMLAYIGIFLSEEKSLTPKRIFVMVLFALAFALTGKRGHLLFFVFAVFVVILINSRDVRWYLFLDIVLIAVMLAIPVLILLKDLFVSVPVLFRIGESLAGIMNGEDITSGRSELAAHALSLFWERPLLGVGWGVYRTTVIGVVTSRTELEVHNIYLQVLCEAGLIGFVTMVVPMVAFLRRAIKNLNLLNKCGKKLPWTKCLAVFSVAYQVFFLSYGMTGNSLYDYNYVMMYFVSCSMTAVVWRDLRKELSL